MPIESSLVYNIFYVQIGLISTSIKCSLKSNVTSSYFKSSTRSYKSFSPATSCLSMLTLKPFSNLSTLKGSKGWSKQNEIEDWVQLRWFLYNLKPQLCLFLKCAQRMKQIYLFYLLSNNFADFCVETKYCIMYFSPLTVKLLSP